MSLLPERIKQCWCMKVRLHVSSIPGCVVPKTLKIVMIPPCLTLSNIRYVSRAKSRERSSALPYTSVL